MGSANARAAGRYNRSMVRGTALVMAATLAMVPALPACTVGAMGTGAAITGIHNAAVDEPDAWDYPVPMLTGAAIGLVVDIVFVYFLERQWSKPMT